MSTTEKSTETLTEKFAKRYSVDPRKLMSTLKATVFKQKAGSPEVTNEQMMALLVVADQYGLNPFTKEIYAFPDKKAGIIPVVGVDGWSRIINSNSQFDGLEFNQSDNYVSYPDGESKPCPEWIECVIYRKDRRHAIKVREYLDEVYRPPFKGNGSGGSYKIDSPWQTHTKRFLRHKSMIQCARIAFGFVGLYDQDEAERIIESQSQKESSKTAIQINEVEINPVAIAPKVNDEFSQDLESANFGGGFEDAEFAEIETKVAVDGVVDRDKSFIVQLVSFAKQSSSWDTTLDNFKERYSGETLEYAKTELNNAYIKSVKQHMA